MSVALMAGVSLFGCQAASDEGTRTYMIKGEKDLGIVKVVIEHEDTKEGRLMIAHGYTEKGEEVANATVRTGIVYDPDYTSHTADDEREGRELTVTVGSDTAELVILHRSPEQRDSIAVAPIRSFLRIDEVAAAIKEEAELTFKDVEGSVEGKYNLGCGSERFPHFKPATSSCCEYQTGHDQKIMEGANVGKLGHRNFGAACTLASGATNCVGNTCSFGPCGTTTPVVTGTTAGVIFDPFNYAPNPQLCGTDLNGSAPGGGIPLDYDPGVHTPYAGVGATCPFISCAGGGIPIIGRKLFIGVGAGTSGLLSTNETTAPHPNVNVNLAVAYGTGPTQVAAFQDGLTVTLKAVPNDPHTWVQLDDACQMVGAPGQVLTCQIQMTSDRIVGAKFYCEDGFTCL